MKQGVNDIQQDWLRVRDVARRLSLPLSTTYHLIHSGRLRAISFKLQDKSSRIVLRIPRPEFERFVREVEQESGTDASVCDSKP